MRQSREQDKETDHRRAQKHADSMSMIRRKALQGDRRAQKQLFDEIAANTPRSTARIINMDKL